MKLNKEVTNKILNFYLLKFRSNGKKNVLNESSVKAVLNNIKKILFIILQFHRSGKRVMFIGLSPKTKLFISKFTNHIAIDSTIDLKDFLSKGLDYNSFNRILLKSNSNIKAVKPDLLVVLSHYQNDILLTECFRLKVPFINYDFYSGLFKINSIKSMSHVETSNSNILFFFEVCLLFLFKKIFKYPAISSKISVSEKSKKKLNRNNNRS